MYNVFVYGTLKAGHGNHRLLENSKLLHEATITGKMVSLGGFPCVSTNGDNQIHGEVYEVDDQTLGHLDHLESNGSFYTREIVNSSKGPVWVYLIQDEGYYQTRPLIRNGVWRGAMDYSLQEEAA